MSQQNCQKVSILGFVVSSLIDFEQDNIANNTHYPLDILKLLLVVVRKFVPHLIIISSDDITFVHFFAWS